MFSLERYLEALFGFYSGTALSIKPNEKEPNRISAVADTNIITTEFPCKFLTTADKQNISFLCQDCIVLLSSSSNQLRA